MSLIKHNFKMFFPHISHTIMYSELNDGRFTKTFIKNNKLETQFIKTGEYASALSFFTIQNIHRKPPTH